VEVEVLPASAGYTSELWLLAPGEERFIATNRDVGKVVALGSFPNRSELVFGIRRGAARARGGRLRGHPRRR
jgi:hypothetical protein